jgi:hypothetical protein
MKQRSFKIRSLMIAIASYGVALLRSRRSMQVRSEQCHETVPRRGVHHALVGVLAGVADRRAVYGSWQSTEF